MRYSKKTKYRYKSTAVEIFFRRVAMVLVFPFAFLWFFLIAWNPKLKKYWNPEAIKVRIIGKVSSDFLGFHGKAYVSRIPDEVNTDTPNPCMGFPVSDVLAFVVDRPELLTELSKHTLRMIEKQFKDNGYQLTSLLITVGGKSAMHVL